MLFNINEVIFMDESSGNNTTMEWFMDVPEKDAQVLLKKWNESLVNGMMELPPEISWGKSFVSGPNRLNRQGEVGIYLISQSLKKLGFLF